MQVNLSCFQITQSKTKPDLNHFITGKKAQLLPVPDFNSVLSHLFLTATQ